MVILAFWFFSRQKTDEYRQRSFVRRCESRRRDIGASGCGSRGGHHMALRRGGRMEADSRVARSNVANDPPNDPRRGRPDRRDSRLDVLQLPEIRERYSVRLLGGSSALRAGRSPNRKSDRRLPLQPRAKCLRIRSAADSYFDGGSQGLAPLAAGDDDAAPRRGRASADDCVQQNLERRFVLRAEVHARIDRAADAPHNPRIRDGRRSRAEASDNRGSRGNVHWIHRATDRRLRVRCRDRA